MTNTTFAPAPGSSYAHNADVLRRRAADVRSKEIFDGETCDLMDRRVESLIGSGSETAVLDFLGKLVKLIVDVEVGG